jgi:hypothetical protein
VRKGFCTLSRMDPTDALPCGPRGHDLGQAPTIERTVFSLSAIVYRQKCVNDAGSTY